MPYPDISTILVDGVDVDKADLRDFLAFTSGLIVSGKVGATGRTPNTTLQIEATGGQCSFSQFMLDAADLVQECALAHWGFDAASNMNKIMSLSTVWGDTSATSGYAVSRWNATYKVGGVAFDDLVIRIFGGKGATINANDNTDFPTSLDKLMVRGGVSALLSSNTLATVLTARNTNAGASAQTVAKIGNDTAAGIFAVTVNSSAHASPSKVQVATGIDTPLFLGANAVDQVRLASDGALGIRDGVTAPSTVAGWGQIYIDTADGDLKIKFGDGTVKTIVVDT